jgi:hypothetical protein
MQKVLDLENNGASLIDPIGAASTIGADSTIVALPTWARDVAYKIVRLRFTG